MQTQTISPYITRIESTEFERLQEQASANRRRLAHYRAAQNRATVEEIPVELVQLNLIPDEYFEKPAFLRRQAD